VNATDLLQKMGETLGTANVKAVFGEPIHANGRTVVPVAKVAYAFGGGAGAGKGGANAERQGEGGGGGGAVRAFPAGALEITNEGTRFVPFMDLRWLTGTFAAGAILGSLFAMRAVRNTTRG
jgi:uncharacterized spore protein YtfJ